MKKEKEKYPWSVKATVTLEIEKIIEAADHEELKRKLKEYLIKEGFSFIKYNYISSKKLPRATDEEINLDYDLGGHFFMWGDVFSDKSES